MEPTTIAILGLLIGVVYSIWAIYQLGQAILALLEFAEYQENRIIELERNSK